MPKGVYPHKPRPDRSEALSLNTPDKAEFNKVILAHGLEVMKLGKANLKDPDDVLEHTTKYFEICLKNSIKPSIAGYALALGISRIYVFEVTHNNKDNVCSETVNIVKNACAFINQQMETYMQEGAINPVAGIFLMKNNMGYKDQVDYVVAPKENDSVNTEEIQNRYLIDSDTDTQGGSGEVVDQ